MSRNLKYEIEGKQIFPFKSDRRFRVLSTLHGQFLYDVIQFFPERSFDRKVDVKCSCTRKSGLTDHRPIRILWWSYSFSREETHSSCNDVLLYDTQGDNKDQVNKEMIESMLKRELTQQEGEETDTGQSEGSLPNSIRESPEVTCYNDNEEDKTYG